MRIQILMLPVVTFGILVTTAAHGREMAGKIGITPQLGTVIPAGEYRDRREVGFTYGLDAEYFATDNLSFGFRVFHHGLPNIGGVVWAHFGFGDDHDIWPVDGLGAQARCYRAVTPFTDMFGRVGIIIGRMEFPVHRPFGIGWGFESSRTTETMPGWEVGIGISRHLSRRFSAYGEIGYALLFTKGLKVEKEPRAEWHSYDLSYNTQMVAIKAGLTLYFGCSR